MEWYWLALYIGMLAVGLFADWYLSKPMATVPERDEPVFKTGDLITQEAAATGLQHARAMQFHAADLRSRNFNYFLVFVGLLAVAAKEATPWIAVISASGMVLGLVFWGLDIRTWQLIRDGRADLLHFEKFYGLTTTRADLRRDRTRGIPQTLGRPSLVTHTSLYRFVFLGISALCVVVLIELTLVQQGM